MHPDITFAPGFLKKFKRSRAQTMHLVMVGTKPDIIKQSPLVLELKRRKQCVVFGDTGQHYDHNLTRDAKELTGLTPDFNLHVRGELYEKIGRIIERFGQVLHALRGRGHTVIPYAHGDTTTAMALSAGAYMNEVPVVHVEAGLRSFTPRREIFDAVLTQFSFPLYAATIRNARNWEKGSIEPYPEQYNTRTVAPSAAFHAAPTDTNRKNLLAEGFRADRIKVVGNSVADAVAIALSQKSDVFKEWPMLKNGFIRCAVHRRENVASRHRFSVIMETLMELAAQGRTILLVSHALTLGAVKEYGFYPKLKALKKKFPNFIFEERLLPYRDNIHACTKAKLNITDSGSEQEEGNIMGFPTATARFGSDRPETVWAGGNIIAPPLAKSLFKAVILGACDNPALRRAPKLYGQQVTKKIVDEVMRIKRRERLFQWEHERFGFTEYDFWQK